MHAIYPTFPKPIRTIFSSVYYLCLLVPKNTKKKSNFLFPKITIISAKLILSHMRAINTTGVTIIIITGPRPVRSVNKTYVITF
jgi:hypothetical protein